MTNIFYVYLHRTVDSGHAFYVGKGSGRRAWSRVNRNPDWHKMASRGYRIDIPKDGMRETCAYTLERILIFLAPNDEICNEAQGGPGGGMFGKTHSPEAKKKMSRASKGRAKSGKTRKAMSEGTRRAWQDPDYRESHATAIRKKTVYRWTHPEHGTFSCTQYEIGKRFNFSRGAASSLIKGTYKSYKGWKLS